MRSFSIIIILFFSVFFTQAQQPGVADTSKINRSGRDTAAFRNMPAIGKVMGILKDSTTKANMEFASIAVLRLRDSSAVGGALTDEKGRFLIEELKPGRYIIRITSIGFRTLDSKPFLLTPQDAVKDFGSVYMPPSNKNLKEVKIEGEKEQYVNSLDKKIYNVEKDIVATGGTAADIMKNIPSVNIDVDGKVSLRGSENVTILIDGKPSGVGGGDKAALLQQLPAGSIESVEIITNPSARYDAEGMAGIINIKTKHDKNNGLNGTVSVGVGTGDKYNSGFTLNNRGKKVNLYTSYNVRQENRTFEGASDRLNLYNEPNTIYTTDNEGLNHNETHNAKLGADFFLSQYNTLSASFGYNNRFETRNERIDYSFQSAEGISYLDFYRRNHELEKSDGGEGLLDFKHVFPGSKTELTASASFNMNQRKSNERYANYFTDATLQSSRNITDAAYSTAVVQSDFVHPINDKSKFEAGVKGTMRRNDNDVTGLQSQDGENFVVVDNYTNRFIYTDKVFAGYAQYTGKFMVFDYMAGVRTEASIIEGDSRADSSDFTNDYIDLFPSATVKYTVNQVNELQVSYSRRINRPGQGQLNPFTDYADSLNVRSGNPKLSPEYISSIELGYFRRIKEQSVGATIYYRYTTDLITRYRIVEPVSGVTTTTFRNFSSSQNIGLELVLRNQLGKKFSATTSVNIFQNKIDGSNVDAELQSNATNWNARTTINYKLFAATSLQVTANYMAPSVNPQGTFKGMSGVDVGFRQDFMKGKLNLSISVSDIFDIRKFEIHQDTPDFISDFYRKRESRVANFTLSYRFGVADTSKRKQNRTPELQQDMNNQGDF
ncbi:outer membrane beta-barrel family protein [soil metagenome]